MSTKLSFFNSRSQPYGTGAVKDMAVSGGGTTSSPTTTVNIGDTEVQLAESGSPLSFWSRRMSAQTTISGTVTFKITAKESTETNATLRAKLYKITSGGSDVESLIGSANAAAPLTTTSAAYTFTMTPTSTTLAVGERLICRVFVANDLGTMAAGTITFYYAGTPIFDSNVTTTENLSLKPNGVVLLLRRTTTTGIGAFMDMLEARGVSAFTTAVVDTAAGGTDIPWTHTAGGSVAEWISGRCAHGWTFAMPGFAQLQFSGWAKESNALANAKLGYRLYRRQPDGVETLIAGPGAVAAEMITTAAQMIPLVGGQTQTNFNEDDRLVVRLHLTNNGTMAAGHTATLDYDGPTASADGDSKITIREEVAFKAETDPARSESVPGGQTLGGVGN